MRIPVATDLIIDGFGGGVISDLDAGITNGVVEKDGGRVYVTQRPSIDTFELASDHVSDAKGRAIYYWETTGSIYILNNGTLYKGSQNTSISTSPGAGTKKCYFLEVDSLLVLLDQENNQGFTINSSDTVTEITDVDFPPKQTPNVQIAYGGTILGGYLFVMGEDAIIYNSDSGDPTTWGALSFKAAERKPGDGVYCGKHYDNLVALKANSIEFFYLNPTFSGTGSPLNRREDIFYSIGCTSGQSVWEIGDRMFFVGANSSGAIGVYMLDQYTPVKISTGKIDSFISQSVVKEGLSTIGSGFTAQGHTFYILTVYGEEDTVSPYTTLVYDDYAKLWYQWDYTIDNGSHLPVISWSKRTGISERYGEGILTNGNLITLNDNLVPIDTEGGDTYVVSGYVYPGYVETSASDGTNITLTVRTGMFDNNSNNVKFPQSLELVMDTTENSGTTTVKWSDENNKNFNTGRSIATEKYQKATRIGRFRRRNHEITYSGSDYLKIEALQFPFREGRE